jgi:hypothetical protein
MITLLINDPARPSVLTTSYAFQDETDLGIDIARCVLHVPAARRFSFDNDCLQPTVQHLHAVGRFRYLLTFLLWRRLVQKTLSRYGLILFTGGVSGGQAAGW